MTGLVGHEVRCASGEEEGVFYPMGGFFFLGLPIWSISVSSETSFKARVAKSRDRAVRMEDDEAGVERSDLRGWRVAVEDGLRLGAGSSRR